MHSPLSVPFAETTALTSTSALPSAGRLRAKINLSRNWRFALVPPGGETDYATAHRADEAWEWVHLPHTPKIEAAEVQFHFQGFCWYRKTIRAAHAWLGKRLVLEFEAGMQIADIWVNGVYQLRHLGGYLPFSVDLSESLGAGRDAEISVLLDNRDTELCPPGKPLAGLDFSYFGGLYREVHLHVTNDLHISDQLHVQCPAGGGIFVRCEDVTESHARVLIKSHALNESPKPLRRCRVISEVHAPNGTLLHRAESFPLLIGAGEGHHFEQVIEIEKPALWHPDAPHLHKLVTRVIANGVETDVVETRFGIRHLAVTNRFLLNGKELQIRGCNRHQEHPCIGNAVPKHAQRRDARRIKDAGFNFVRLSHYPQDPAFLEACDELGILVQAAVPGWQQFWMNDSFIRQSFQDIRELVRRDRNHASIVFWEPNLNETGVGEDGEGHSDWCRTAHEITHQEFPGDQCLTFGDDYPVKPGWDWDVRGFWREYGDFAYGGNESTSRQTRGHGEQAMLQQTWNFLWTFNHLSARFADANEVYLGCAVWVMFDYNRGYYHRPCECGMMDLFRLPKVVHAFYQSQRDPHFIRPDVASGPMAFLATDWTKREGETKVVVFSNCDEIELMLNGRSIARQKPDAGPDTEYSQRTEASLATVGDDYDRTGGNPFDGGNAKHLPHAPFTFPAVAYEPGQLVAVGYLEGLPAAIHKVSTPGKPDWLELAVDLAGVALDEESLDVVFVHAKVLDAQGRLVVDRDLEVAFAVVGPGEFIGENPVRTQAGVASILLRTHGPAKELRLAAQARGEGGELRARLENFPQPWPRPQG